MSDEEVKAKALKEAEALDQAVEKGATTVPTPPKLEEEEGAAATAGETTGSGSQSQTPSQQQSTPQRKKPRKLEIRSGGGKTVST